MRGFGQVFLNIVLDDAVEEKDGGEKVRLGMVVRSHSTGGLMKEANMGSRSFEATQSLCSKHWKESAEDERTEGRGAKSQIEHVGGPKVIRFIMAFSVKYQRKAINNLLQRKDCWLLELLPIFVLESVNHGSFEIFYPALDSSLQNQDSKRCFESEFADVVDVVLHPACTAGTSA